MIKYQFGNFETEIDPTDVEFMKRYELAAQHYKEKMQTVSEGQKLSETLEIVCRIFYDTLDELFGEGTSAAMFGKTRSVDQCIKAFQQFTDVVNNYGKSLKQAVATGNIRTQKRRTKY